MDEIEIGYNHLRKVSVVVQPKLFFGDRQEALLDSLLSVYVEGGRILSSNIFRLHNETPTIVGVHTDVKEVDELYALLWDTLDPVTLVKFGPVEVIVVLDRGFIVINRIGASLVVMFDQSKTDLIILSSCFIGTEIHFLVTDKHADNDHVSELSAYDCLTTYQLTRLEKV